MKTSELTGAALDWAVAKCEKQDIRDIGKFSVQVAIGNEYDLYAPSKYWSQGGSIIDLHISRIEDFGDYWEAESCGFSAEGETALVAAMRAYVTAKLGFDVSVPEELK